MDGEDFGSGKQRNVLGGMLIPCSIMPMTGFYRDGCCHTGVEDAGSHTVCAVMTDSFLTFSKNIGNDLSTPRPEFGFPGLVEGDNWCLCAARWEQARRSDAAPHVRLAATNQAALSVCALEHLAAHALDAPDKRS
ncbi:DUF2237 domain-containing protein [Alphaproteobacteria bacterium]|nr:DUF2237 domain-containing protein [Alphaproteobacteria bacterium]